MSFDPQTGKPVAAAGGFDPNTGQPIAPAPVAAVPAVALLVVAANPNVEAVPVVTIAAGPAASPYGACCQCNYRCMGIIGVVRGPPPRTWRNMMGQQRTTATDG